jgi:FG-GAP-like repeat
MRPLVVVLAGALVPATAAAAPLWDDKTASTIGTTAEWTSKLELADLDGDGWIDIFFANGGNYSDAGTPEPQRVFRNLGNWAGAGPHFQEISSTVFGAAGTRLSRVNTVRDIDGDGDLDVFVGGAHGTASGLFVQGPKGVFTDKSATALPQGKVALGDAELGDVDGDGDLDLVLADWGAAPISNGGPTRLWLNDGHGKFTDATAQMPTPTVKVGMSWDLELVDLDDDADLDVLVSCKLCTGGKAFINDGTGHFTDESAARLPQHANNYEYEPMDIDGDGDLDLVTINDGPSVTETVLVNDGHGVFADASATALAGDNNVAGADDNCDTFLDVDNDGDADFIIGSLSDADRLLRNDGHGVFTLDSTVMTLDTPGTLGLLVADLDHDGRLDVVQSQGEVDSPDKVLLANAGVAIDTQPPVVRVLRAATLTAPTLIARVHDHKSPSVAGDWKAVELELTAPAGAAIAMTWRGEYEWAVAVPTTDATQRFRVCATDAAGNRGCGPEQGFGGKPEMPDAGVPPDADFDGGTPSPDAGGPANNGGGGGCCDARTDPSAGGGSLLMLAVLLWRSRRRRAARSS